MKLQFNKLIIIIVCFSLLTSCKYYTSVKEKKDAIVSVGDKYLYCSDLYSLLPENISDKDSLSIVTAAIDNWVKQQVLLHKSKENIHRAEELFEKQIEDYRNSLIIFSYQSKLVNQLLDTTIAMEEIQQYYDANKSTFYLKSNIVRAKYAKIAKKGTTANKIRKLMFTDSIGEKDLLDLGTLCQKYTDDFLLENDTWIFFNDLLKKIPIQTYNQENFLKNRRNNRKLEMKVGGYTYFVVIEDFRVRNDLPPLEFEIDRIRYIILNKRKQAIIEKMQEDFLIEASASGLIRYF